MARLSTQPDIIALSFHVGYWDDLGWRDRFALPESVERQNNYARNLHHASVYTPQLVVDGREDDFRSDGKVVARALSQNRDGVPVGVTVHDAEIQVHIGAQPGGAPSDVMLVSYLRHAVSNIGRGENAGRTLEEFNIVRDVRTLGPWKGEMQNFSVPISSLPSDDHRRRRSRPAARSGSDYRSRRLRTALIELTFHRKMGRAIYWAAARNRRHLPLTTWGIFATSVHCVSHWRELRPKSASTGCRSPDSGHAYREPRHDPALEATMRRFFMRPAGRDLQMQSCAGCYRGRPILIREQSRGL